MVVFAFAFGCGGSAPAPEVPRVPVARQAAVGKMVKAVSRAARPDARKEALALLEEAVKEDPELWEARYDLGVLLAQSGALDRAREQLERAHALAPNAEDVVAALGEVLRRKGEHAAAASQPSAQSASPVTFGRHIAPIVFEHCVSCHRPDGAAPLLA